MSDTLQFPKPDFEATFSLVNADTRERWTLTPNEKVTAGRAEDNSLSLKDDVYASGHHAELYFEDGQYYLKDLNSRNGTYKNNEPVVGVTPISKGDLITFGRTKFEVQ
jgi:pSer/pThr/pTyr-binding forkhead associated (FHA) protein